MKIKVLNQRHPEYSPEKLARYTAIEEGGEAFHALKGSLFPKRTVEPEDVYRERLELVTYTNHVGGSVARLSALLFSEPPVVSARGTWWDTFLSNVDRQGSSWTSFWRARVNDALAAGRAWCWVNLPRRVEGLEVRTRADEESAGLLNAYLVRFAPDQVLDWGEDEAGRLGWVMARDVTELRPDVQSPRRCIWRWRYIDDSVIRTWTWEATTDRPVPSDEDEATEQPMVEHRVGRIPVTRLKLPKHLHVLAMVYDVALAATRAENDLTWALHQAANELMVVTSKWGDETPTLGHGHYFRLGRDPDGEDKAEFIGPSGVAFDHLEKRVNEAREDVFRAFGQMAVATKSDSAKSQLSAASKRADWQAAEIMLAALAEPTLDAMRQTLAVLAAIRGEDAPQVSGLDGWQQEDIQTFLDAVNAAVDARELSPTFRKVVAKREAERILQDEVAPDVMSTILKEIDESDPEMSAPLMGAPRRDAPTPPGQDPTQDEGQDPSADAGA